MMLSLVFMFLSLNNSIEGINVPKRFVAGNTVINDIEPRENKNDTNESLIRRIISILQENVNENARSTITPPAIRMESKDVTANLLQRLSKDHTAAPPAILWSQDDNTAPPNIPWSKDYSTSPPGVPWSKDYTTAPPAVPWSKDHTAAPPSIPWLKDYYKNKESNKTKRRRHIYNRMLNDINELFRLTKRR